MGAVSATTVASFESVGAILVVALLIGPPATAYLLTDDFRRMLLLAVGIGVIDSILGFILAVWLDGSIAGGIAIITGITFLLALLFSPAHGILRRKLISRDTKSDQVAAEQKV